jgi:hypothetical protein
MRRANRVGISNVDGDAFADDRSTAADAITTDGGPAPSGSPPGLLSGQITVILSDYGVTIQLPPPDPDAIGRLARLLVEQATTEVLNPVAGVQNSDAAGALTPTASRETVLDHHHPEEG